MKTKKSKARRIKLSESHDPGRCLILTLPNELLSLIIQNCDTSDLLLAASICKLLNTFAISSYLAQIRFNPRSIILGSPTNNGISFSALRGLRLAFSIKSINSIACYLPPECTTELREVHRWLDCLSSVRSFRICFNSAWQIRYREPTLVAAPFAEVLGALHGKQCSSFWVAGDVQSGPEQVDPIAATLSTLRMADIGSAVFFSRPFVDWTVFSLNDSQNLNTLNLQNLTAVNCAMLARLRLPALRTLSITSSVILHHHMSSFCSEHAKLEKLLLIGVQFLPQLAQSQAFPSTLPNVERLTCDVGDLVHELLSSQSSFPKLKSISLRNDVMCGTQADVARHLGMCFDMISQRPQIKRLWLSLTGAYAIVPWLRMGNRPRRCHVYKDKCRLEEIEDLTVSGIERSVVDLLPPWLALFPRLKKLAVLQFSLKGEEMVGFVRQAKETCIGLDVVSFSLRCTKSVDEWLS